MKTEELEKVNKEEAKRNTESKFCVEIQYKSSIEEALFPVNRSSKPSVSSVSLPNSNNQSTCLFQAERENSGFSIY